MKALSGLIIDLKEQLGFDCSIQSSSVKQDSDLAIACFQLAKSKKIPPNQIANDLVANLDHPLVDKSQADGGYINLFLDSNQLAKQVEKMSTKELLDKPESGQPVLIEYCSVNLGKRISFGHLRNLFIGRGLVNLYRYFGYDVITDNHIGDAGKVFGMWVAGYLRFSSPDELQTNGNQELNKVYIEVSQRLKADKSQDLLEEVVDWTLRLEQGEQMAVDYHQLFSQISLEDLNQSLNLLKIKFDHCLGEAFYLDLAHRLVDDLIKDGLAIKQTDGSVIVDLSSEGRDIPLLLLKSNGGCLYATTDIATLKYRQDQFQPQKVIYVVASEQKFAFEQLFAFNKIASYSTAELIHCDYGLILEKDEAGTRRKMSSRRGAVLLQDVLDKAVENTKRIVKDNLSDKDIDIIAQGALTFSSFCYRRLVNVVFDWDNVFSLTAKSGPYVQYSIVRLNSILEKADVEFDQPIFNKEVNFKEEHQLLFLFLSYPDVLEEAFLNNDSSLIADHVYQFARQLNRYYETTKILGAETVELKVNRLWLINKIKQQLTEALGLLGMEVPNQM